MVTPAHVKPRQGGTRAGFKPSDGGIGRCDRGDRQPAGDRGMASNADADRPPASQSSQQRTAEVEGRHRRQGAEADAAREHGQPERGQRQAHKREVEELTARLQEAEAAGGIQAESNLATAIDALTSATKGRLGGHALNDPEVRAATANIAAKDIVKLAEWLADFAKSKRKLERKQPKPTKDGTQRFGRELQVQAAA